MKGALMKKINLHIKIALVVMLGILIVTGITYRQYGKQRAQNEITQKASSQKKETDLSKKKEDTKDKDNAVPDQATSKNNKTVQKEETASVIKKVICVDAGHQRRGDNTTEPIGPGASTTKPKVTTGATGNYTGKAESEVNLEVAMKLKEILQNRGYEVIMCRTSQDVNLSNSARAAIANKANASAFVRLHCDSSTSSSLHGVSGLAPANSNRYMTNDNISASQSLTRSIVSSVCNITGARNRGLMLVNNMSGINWCKVPVCLIEMGFMSNPAEDRDLSSSSYQQKLATGIADGIDQYLNKGN